MRLEGSLDAFSLPDIFQLLSFTKKTGALHLKRADVRGIVHFNAGSVTGAVSDDGRQALGRRLIGADKVDEGALGAAVQRAAGDSSIGVVRALSEAGALDENVLRELLAEQIVDAVFDLLRWPDGEFAFALETTNPDDIGLALPVDELVTEARRRVEYWAQISQAVPSGEAVLMLAPAPAGDPVVSRDEWALLGLIDGRRSVAELVMLTGRGEYALVASLAALVERGLLVVATGEGDPASRLLRRVSLLAPLETVSATSPSSAASLAAGVSAPPAAVSAPRAAEPAPVYPHAVPDQPRSFVPQATAPLQRTPEPAITSAPSVASIPQDQRNVTPARPDVVVPRRQPDFPEDLSGSTGSIGASMGSAATATATVPATSIERDPSVNKSLLLRLIAGVRGL